MDETNPRAAKVTLAAVAEASVVSVSTVSRAFTHPEMLRPETVAMIRAVAERLGYVGNHAARALSTGRFGNIAVLVPDVANPFFPPLVRRIEAIAENAGVAVFLGDSDESPEREWALTQRLSMQTDGFILVSSRLDETKIRSLSQRSQVVLVNREVEGIPQVLIDATGGITEAVTHLEKLGHRRLVYLAGPKQSWSDQQRRNVIAAASARSGVAVEIVELGRPSFDSGRDAVTFLVDGKATAVIAFDDVVASGVLAGLALRGVDVPRDFSVIGCDDTLAAVPYPALTTISAAAVRAGEAAARILLDTLSGRPAATRVVIPTHLVTRSSTGVAPVA